MVCAAICTSSRRSLLGRQIPTAQALSFRLAEGATRRSRRRRVPRCPDARKLSAARQRLPTRTDLVPRTAAARLPLSVTGASLQRMTVQDWLLDSDPALRWQMLRDVIDAPPRAVASERARVATEGWGAALLALRGDDGQWAGVRASRRTSAAIFPRGSPGPLPF